MVDATILFGIAASVFFVAVVLFLWFSATQGQLTSPFYFLPPVLTTVAGIAYLGMTATSLGMLPDPVDVELIRFADWSISTPIITYYLALMAGVGTSTRIAAIVVNVAMIALGYLFVTLSGPLHWIAFGASVAALLVLLYLLVKTFQQALIGSSQSARSLFVSLRDLTIITWSIYPVVYLLGPIGAGLILGPDLDFIVVVLDLTAKVGLMGILLLRQYELDAFLTYDIEAAA